MFEGLSKRGLNANDVAIGVMDGLPGLEKVFKETFSQSMTARCWVHAKRNALAKCSVRLLEPFEKLLNDVMYANSESQARINFKFLKEKMNTNCERAVHCIEKDLRYPNWWLSSGAAVAAGTQPVSVTTSGGMPLRKFGLDKLTH